MQIRSTNAILCWSLAGAVLLAGCSNGGGASESGMGGANQNGGMAGSAGAGAGGRSDASGTGGVGAAGGSGAPAAGGSNATTGGAAGKSATGGTAAPTGGTAGVTSPGDGSAGGARDDASADAAVDVAIVTPLPAVSQVYNGGRGQEFNAGWRFNRGDVTGAEATTFNDASWRTLDVPHDWSIELAFNSNSPGGSSAGYLDGGIGWYRKTFTLDAASSGQRVFVDFDGVYMNSQVWINGTSLGTRPYGYSTFEYDLTPYVKFDGSKNVLAVKVNNNQPNSRWYSGSGIYRNVWLSLLSPVHIPQSGVFVATPTVSATEATVSVATDIQNQSSTATSVVVTATVLAADGSTITSNDSASADAAAGAQITVQQSLVVPSPQRWSVSSPYLYQLKVELKVSGATIDTYRAPFGIRTETFDANTGFALNGESMKLRGVCLHHDLGALGTAINNRAIERQIQILKGMGVNAIRTSHNPPAPELLDLADRLGVLIMDEAFDTWTQTKTTNDYGNFFTTWAKRDIQDMVRRDRNHPSVIIWSIGNEVAGSTTTVAQNLKGWVQAIDKTRPVTWASNKMAGPHVSEGDDRNVAAMLDLVGYNYANYTGDYDADHAANPTWKIFGSETTAAVRSRGVYHTPASTITKATSQSSADRQCSSYDNETTGFGNTAEGAYAYDHDRAFVAGMFIWSGFDYIGEPTPYSSWPSKSSYFGIVDTAGFPKDIYYFYKSRWTTDPVVHILPHWNWTTGTTVTVYVYNNCDSVELFLNDKSQGAKTMTGSTLHAQWSVPWASGTLRADCTKGGSVVATDTVKTAGAASKVVLSADRNAIHADGQDLVFVTADIRDANGVFVPTGNNSITFSVTGAGQLVGVDNGDPTDTASYKGTSRKAFSGKALAIVRATTTAGTITIKATASGLSSDPLTVTSQ